MLAKPTYAPIIKGPEAFYIDELNSPPRSRSMKSFLIRDILSGQDANNNNNNNNSSSTDDDDDSQPVRVDDDDDDEDDVVDDDEEEDTHGQLARPLPGAPEGVGLLHHHHHQSAAAAAAAFQLNSPLDALFQMTSSTFDALKRGEKRKGKSPSGDLVISSYNGALMSVCACACAHKDLLSLD